MMPDKYILPNSICRMMLDKFTTAQGPQIMYVFPFIL